MRTTAENLQAILDARTAIATSIAGKGITVPQEAKLNSFPALIDSIQQGGATTKNPEIVDLVFNNPVENHDSCNIDVVVRVMSYGSSVSNCGIQYRQKGTTEWITATTPTITDNSDTKTQHGFDKIVTSTLTNLLYQQSYNETLGALVENNNRYEIRGYIAYGSETIYSVPRGYTTGWSRYFDDIYNSANNLELGGTKQKRYIAVMPTVNVSKVLSQLSGDYYATSDNYLGASETHVFDESKDIPIYNIDGNTIKYYVRWVIIYSTVSSSSISINDGTNKSYLYCYFGACTISSLIFASDAYYTGSSLENIRFSNDTTINYIGDNSFIGCHSLASIIIPNSVTSIGSSAFMYCFSLASIIIPNSVTSIAGTAFASCYTITSITIPNSITSIREGAFKSCNGLTSITLSNSMSIIYQELFNGSTSLKLIVIPSSITTIQNSIFQYCYAFTSIIIPNSVTSIGSYVFNNCAALPSIIIPNSVITIGSSAFSGCKALNSIIISNLLTSIENSLFSGCSSLYIIIIPNSVKTIGAGAFNGCNNLLSIIIPNSVTSIGDNAFSSCPSLHSIIIPNSVTTIGSNVFQSCHSLNSIIIPSSVTSIGNGVFQDSSSLRSITFKGIINSFNAGQMVLNGKNLFNVSIPIGWNKSINLIANASYLQNNVLTHKSILAIFNNLASGVTGLTLTLGATNLARMSGEEKLIATNKGWTLN